MDRAIYHKFKQHHDLREELLSTGNAELIEVRIPSHSYVSILTPTQDSDKDAFWGVGADRKGRNELGKALMRLREKLRREQEEEEARAIAEAAKASPPPSPRTGGLNNL